MQGNEDRFKVPAKNLSCYSHLVMTTKLEDDISTTKMQVHDDDQII